MSFPGSVTLVGAGRMGGALLRGWLKGPASVLNVVEPVPDDRVQALAASGHIRLNPPAEVSDVLVLGVKPQQFSAVAETARAFAGPDTRAVSIMAGVRLDQLRSRLGLAHVIRARPNTPGAVGRGVTVFCVPGTAAPQDIALARALLAPLGEVHGPVSEDLMPVVTALSGSGPAYVFLLAELMAQAGVAQGLPADLAARLARRTVEGAAALLAAGDESADDLRRAVTSPGGTTAAALDILMGQDGMAQVLGRAMAAAARRDRELSDETG